MSDYNYWTTLRQRKISRRTMLGASAKAGVGAAGLALVGCGDDDDDGAVAGDAAAAEAAAAAGDSSAAAAAAERAAAAAEEAAAAAAAAGDAGAAAVARGRGRRRRSRRRRRARGRGRPGASRRRGRRRGCGCRRGTRRKRPARPPPQPRRQPRRPRKRPWADMPSGEVRWPTVQNLSALEATVGTGGDDHQAFWAVHDNLVVYNPNLSPDAEVSLAQSWEDPGSAERDLQPARRGAVPRRHPALVGDGAAAHRAGQEPGGVPHQGRPRRGGDRRGGRHADRPLRDEPSLLAAAADPRRPGRGAHVAQRIRADQRGQQPRAPGGDRRLPVHRRGHRRSRTSWARSPTTGCPTPPASSGWSSRRASTPRSKRTGS